MNGDQANSSSVPNTSMYITEVASAGYSDASNKKSVNNNKLIEPDSSRNHGDNASTPSNSYFLGIHTCEKLDDTDLPEFVKEHQATLTFPEKLMLMLIHAEKGASSKNTTVQGDACISWILDGHAFVISNKDELVKKMLPVFFRQAKFPSFTRKLYRWGFRQISVSPERVNRREMIFGHEHFQRDNKLLLTRMRSVTAAGTRRAVAALTVKQQTISAHPSRFSDGVHGFISSDVTMQDASSLSGHKRSDPGEVKGASNSPPAKRVIGLRQSAQLPHQALCRLAPLSSHSLHEALTMSHRSLYDQNSTSHSNGSMTGNYLVSLAQLSSMNSLRHQDASKTSNPLNYGHDGQHRHLRLNDDVNPNAYMHAAIDLLLRYAS